MKVLTLLLILTSVYFDFCNGKNRIFNGVTTTIKKHPYQVGLLVKINFDLIFLCGGSIINNNTIVTAAHCIQDEISSEMYIVKVGSSKIYNGEDFKVKQIIKHPKYNHHTLTNDVAILKLEKLLTYNDTIKPIELQPKNIDVPGGTKAVTSGWGSINPIQLNLSVELQELEVVVLNKRICNFSYKPYGSKMICVRSKGKSVCSGDSGGPLVINGKLVGITSHVLFNCKGSFPFFFTNVALMRDFIDQNM